MSGFVSYRGMARQAVHDHLAAPATYRDEMMDRSKDVRVRHRFKSALTGTMQNQGSAEQYDTVDRLVFALAELTAAGITLRQHGRVKISDFLGTGQAKTFRLEDELPADGPLMVVWTVGEER